MDTLENLGGRKFVLAIISLVAGLLTHALSPKGLSTEVVAMIVGLVGTFSIANTVSTIKAPPGSSDVIEPAVNDSEQLARIEQTVEAIGKSALQTQDILVKALQARS